MNAFTNADGLTSKEPLIAHVATIRGSNPMRCSKGHKWDQMELFQQGSPDSISFFFKEQAGHKGPYCIRCIAEWMDKNISTTEQDIPEASGYVADNPTNSQPQPTGSFFLIWKDHDSIRVETLQSQEGLDRLVNELHDRYRGNQYGFQFLGAFKGETVPIQIRN